MYVLYVFTIGAVFVLHLMFTYARAHNLHEIGCELSARDEYHHLVKMVVVGIAVLGVMKFL